MWKNYLFWTWCLSRCLNETFRICFRRMIHATGTAWLGDSSVYLVRFQNAISVNLRERPIVFHWCPIGEFHLVWTRRSQCTAVMQYFDVWWWRQQQQQLFYGPLSGTTRMSQYQKKHSPTHHPDHHPVSFHLLQSIASSLDRWWNKWIWGYLCLVFLSPVYTI